MVGVVAGYARLATRGMQVALGLLVVVGVVLRNVSVLVNALLALGVTFLPTYLQRNWRLTLSPLLTLWVAGAALLHAIGMVGLYETVWWWDHVTHVLSAALVAGAGYAITRAVDLHADDIFLPQGFLTVFVLLATLAMGVFWEVLEFLARLVGESIGADPLLVQYGVTDTLNDLVFDLAGAVVVTALGRKELAPLVESIRRVLARIDRR